jgi:hypothetical protein
VRKQRKQSAEYDDRKFSRLWQAASDEALSNSVLHLLKQVDTHVERCAILDGIAQDSLTPDLFASRSFLTAVCHVVKRCDSAANIHFVSPSESQRRHGVVQVLEIQLKRPALVQHKERRSQRFVRNIT